MRRLYSHYKINLVLDIGANEGQYGLSIREMGYEGHIVSFEPQSMAHKRLSSVCGRDPNWTVAPRMAIGRNPGKTEINVAANSESSSILQMSPLHERAAPTSKYTTKETVEVKTLDEVAKSYLLPANKLFVKIDTQGYEEEVLAGASVVLAHAVGVQLEMSLLPLYYGQASYMNLLGLMKDLSFEMAEVCPGFSDPETGRLLQVDGVFFKTQI